jgi:hypothetical protein
MVQGAQERNPERTVRRFPERVLAPFVLFESWKKHEGVLMRRFGRTLGCGFGILLFFCSAAVPVSAAEYSQQDVAACTPDAWRVCFHAIPDSNRVRQCLFDNQRSLSTPCWNVIERARLTREPSGQGQRSTTGQGGQPVQRPRYY